MDHRDVYLNFVHGQWKQGSTGLWDDNRNPSRPSELLGKATRSNASDLEKALDSATQASREWSRKSRPLRAAPLFKAALILKAKLENHSKAIHREHGMSLLSARDEIMRAYQSLEAIASLGRGPVGAMLPGETESSLIYTHRAPLGVVAVIGSCASPLATPAREIGSALLEGNAVVFKPSSLVPGIAAILIRTFEESGVPAGTLNLLYASGASLGPALVQDRRIHSISFCGSNETGLQIAASAAKRNLPLKLESVCREGLIVTADANLDQAAHAAAKLLQGSASIVFVEGSVHASFREKILERVRSFKTGEPTSPDAGTISPLCSERHLAKTAEFVQICQAEGATMLCGGERIGLAPPDSGYYFAPTLLDGIRSEMRLSREEFVGPVMGLQPSGSWDEMVGLLEKGERFHKLTVFTGDSSKALKAADRLPARNLAINPVLTSPDPFESSLDTSFFSSPRRISVELG